MKAFLSVLDVVLGAGLITLILLHSGRDTGFGGLGFSEGQGGGTHIYERNLTRLTVIVAIAFGVLTVVLYRMLR